MSLHESLPSGDAPEQPAMELMGGDAIDATPVTGSLFSRFVRGTLYGAMIVAGTGLLAVSAVPDLAKYASFIPERTKPACSGSSCTALDAEDLYCQNYTPCEEEAVALESGSCSGCPLAQAALTAEGASCCAKSAEVAAVAPACCASKQATETVAATAACSETSGCAAGQTCCQDKLAAAEDGTGEDDSLVKAETEVVTETPAGDQSAED